MEHHIDSVKSDWQPLLLWSSWENAGRSAARVSRDPSAPAGPWTRKTAIASFKLVVLHVLRVLAAAGSPFASALAWSLRQVISSMALSVEIKRVSSSLIGWQGQKIRGLQNVRRWQVTLGVLCSLFCILWELAHVMIQVHTKNTQKTTILYCYKYN